MQERLEKNIRAVLLSAWSFYAQERIFFLKCYYHIISSSMDNDAPHNVSFLRDFSSKNFTRLLNEFVDFFQSVFKKFLEKIPPRERHSALMKQYNTMIHLELPSVNTFGTLADMLIPVWITYNLRAQLELLQLIILMTSQIEVSLNDIDKLIELLQVSFFAEIR